TCALPIFSHTRRPASRSLGMCTFTICESAETCRETLTRPLCPPEYPRCISLVNNAICVTARAKRPTIPPITAISALENLSLARTCGWSEKLQPPLTAAEWAISRNACDALWNSREPATWLKSFHIPFRYAGQDETSLKTVGTKGRSKLERMSQ